MPRHLTTFKMAPVKSGIVEPVGCYAPKAGMRDCRGDGLAGAPFASSSLLQSESTSNHRQPA